MKRSAILPLAAGRWLGFVAAQRRSRRQSRRARAIVKLHIVADLTWYSTSIRSSC